jgi:hypothetical protein
MEADERLREALEARREESAGEAEEQTGLNLRREEYENREKAVRKGLHEMAALTVQALAKESTPESGEGWSVRLGNQEPETLCADGTLVTLDRLSGEPRFSTLEAWIDQRIEHVRSGDERAGGTRFQKAFSPQAWQQEDHQAELRSELALTEKRVIDYLVAILEERNISI